MNDGSIFALYRARLAADNVVMDMHTAPSGRIQADPARNDPNRYDPFASATTLAREVREGRIRAEALLDRQLERVARLNPTVNAVVLVREDEARAAARAVDAALARGEDPGPLAGVPMTVKESVDWAGTPSTRGNPAWRDHRPTEDAIALARLKAAGAVVFGKTNVPLLLQDWQTFNAIHGTTNHPWDPARSPGGSSGGSAAALAAGLTALELGSDIGASIRNPAHFCGVFGHKPTYGIVPWQGAASPGTHARSDLVVLGPLARSARDLDLALGLLAGPTGSDAEAWSLTLPAPRRRALADFRVAVMLESDCCEQDRILTDRLSQAVETLAAAGLRIDRQARPAIHWQSAHHAYLLMLRSATGTRVSQEAFEAHRDAAAARATDDWSYRAYVDRGVALSHRDWWNLHNAREAMRAAWARFFIDYDLLLCPAAASTARPHDQTGDRADRTVEINGGRQPCTDQMFWAGIASLPKLPATVAPAGVAADGLPCGLQIIGPHLQDRRCIAFAALLEDVLGGFEPPPGYD